MKLEDLSGKRFDRWRVIKRGKSRIKNKRKFNYFICECDCGTVKEVLNWSLTRGISKSCGCIIIDKLKTHGKSRSGVYKSWYSMLRRCLNKNHPAYKTYSKLYIDKKWFKFESFYKDMGERPNRMTLDRIDNSKGYYKDNCRWATWVQQANNRKDNVFLTFKGATHTLKEWSRIKNINYSTLKERRSRHKWSIEDILTKEVQFAKRSRQWKKSDVSTAKSSPRTRVKKAYVTNAQ